MFSKKSQEKLDALFLESVGERDFKQAKKWLEKGADIQVADADGNTAFHKLIGSRHLATEGDMDAFVCFLQEGGLDINARNDRGQTGMHLFAENEIVDYKRFNKNLLEKSTMIANFATAWHSACTDQDMTHILKNRGAKLDVQDDRGETPLHIAAGKGYSDKVWLLLGKYGYTCLAIQNNQGKYPHQSAVAGEVGYYELSEKLQQRLEEHRAGENRKAAKSAPVAPASSDDEWTLLKPQQVKHVEDLGEYRLTHIFNFSARTYMQITHNVETKNDVPVTKSFDEVPDKSAIEEAHRELTRLGGKAEESVIYGRPIVKNKLQA